MKKILTLICAGFISLHFTIAAYAADDVAKANYKAARENAVVTYNAARAQCDALSGKPKDICIAEAKADEKRSKANAEAQYKNTPEAKMKARIEIAEADYEVAKEKCNAQMGSAKSACVKQAKAAYANAKIDAKSRINQEGAGEYVEDTVITTKVKAALLAERGLKSPEIKVETFKGTVQLSGFVSSEENMEKAISVARGVQGVQSVKNDMRLK